MSSCTRSHIVVTGTSSGIGRATTLQLAAAGHHVYAGVRRPADADRHHLEHPEPLHHLETFATQTALAIERARLESLLQRM